MTECELRPAFMKRYTQSALSAEFAQSCYGLRPISFGEETTSNPTNHASFFPSLSFLRSGAPKLKQALLEIPMHSDNERKMKAALDLLQTERIQHRQTSPFQIKVGPYNFYPGRGTIFVDGEIKARSERGLEDFMLLIRNPRSQSRHITNNAADQGRPAIQIGFDIQDAISCSP